MVIPGFLTFLYMQINSYRHAKTHDFAYPIQGRIQDFKLGGAHLKKLRRAERGTNIIEVFRVKNHDFTPKNHIFSNFRARAPGAPPLTRPCYRRTVFCKCTLKTRKNQLWTHAISWSHLFSLCNYFHLWKN
jgi:hypothetical protein